MAGKRVSLFVGAVLVAFWCSTAPAFGRDFPESAAAVLVPAPEDSQFSWAHHAYSETAFVSHAFLDSPDDQFQIRTYANYGLFHVQRLATSVFHGVYLISGPVSRDEEAPTVAEWFMNAVQFEYGATVQYGVGPATVLAEYSRRSQHPLRADYGEPAADVVRVGAAVGWWPIPSLKTESLIRLGYVDLYDFWNAPQIPEPRTDWVLSGAFDLQWEPGQHVALFTRLFPELVRTDRDAPFVHGEIELDVAYELGVALTGRAGQLDLFLDGYHSNDTEMREDVRTPVDLLGYGLRFRAATGQNS